MITEERAQRQHIIGSIIGQLGDDPHADRIILPGTDWDIVLEALRLASAQPSDTAQAGGVEGLPEAIRKAKEKASKVYGVAWHRLEEISRIELIIAELPEASPRSPNVDKTAILQRLVNAASLVARKGATTGPQWIALNAALASARAALTRPDEAPTVDKRGEGL